MWRHDRDRPDDPRTRGRETQRLSRDEYERPRYGPAHNDFGTHPHERVSHQGGDERQPGLDDLRVHRVMTRHVASVHPANSVERAAKLMAELDCGALPVVNDNNVLIGIISDRDITIRIVAQGREARHSIVRDCMTERVIACHANDRVAECMQRMARNQVKRLPVVDDERKLVGILAQGDLARR